MTSGENARARGDPFLWAGAASCAGGLTTAAALPALVVTTLAGMLLLRAGARWLTVAIVALFAVAAVRAHRAVDRHERARAAVVEVGGWPARCAVRGVVARSPSMLGGGLRVEVDGAVLCRDDGPPVLGRAALHVPLDARPDGALARGDEIVALASVAPPYRFWNDGLADPRPPSARREVVLSGGAEDIVIAKPGSGIAWTIDRVRARLRGRILASFPADTAPMARALVLGEDDLPESDQQAFRRSGLAHLLAVSGMHLVLVVMGLVAALRALLVRVPALAARMDVGRVAAAVGLPVAWLYAELAGGSGSAVRAAWMCSVALLARALARRSDPWRALGLSLFAMSLADPLVSFDLSFVLSALATTGLLALSRPIEVALSSRLRIGERTLPEVLAKPIATTAAATIACAPVLAMMAPELPLSGLVANVVAVPLGEAAALPLCLLHALLAKWPAAERGCAEAASGALVLVRIVARGFTWGALPVPAPTAAELAVCAGATVGIVLGEARRLWIGLGAATLVALELVLHVRGSPERVLRVTFLDVGQGDAALIDLPDGSAMLVDGGGLVGSPIDVGERVVGRILAARRRRSLAVVVLTHPHPDHHLGLTSALARVETKSFWDTGQGEAEGTGGPYAALLGEMRRRGVPVLGPADLCGRRTIGGASLEVLAPCPAFAPDRGANDNSFVLRIGFGDRAILFTGDAEREEEKELVERLGESLRADVLKVGHHGSRTSSSPEFLDAVRPRVAVISCGVRNRFGHPHASTLDTLARSGTRVLRTDRDGGIIVTTDGRDLDVRSTRER